MDSVQINRCFMRFEDRAERITAKQVAETFVTVGPLMDLLSSNNNQIMYGRRGTGKTHALRYFQSLKNKQGDIAIYIDAQNLGSNGSIYNDPEIPISERAVRLLVDVCSSIHRELLDIFTDPSKKWDMGQAISVLDGFVSGFNESRVSGPVEAEASHKDVASNKATFSLTGAMSSSPSAGLSAASEDSSSTEGFSRVKVSGTKEAWISFDYFSKTIKDLAKFVEPKRVWVLIDEWTTVPTEIQPYLADLLRRSMFSVPNISVKIAAIEHRAAFKLDRADEGYVGFELGADISASINLDDYLIIDNDEDRAKHFFQHFIINHIKAVAEELCIGEYDDRKIISSAFTQDNVFTEFVRATEGVPRDAMHLLSIAAQKANASAISMPVVRNAAYSFFQTEKYAAIQANKENRILLDWIRDEVIGERRTRAFLLPVSTEDLIIDRLFDRRALHILNRSRSAAHRPGERFIVYKLDYGLYVDLINTDKYPLALLSNETDHGDIDFDVPLDDARSYRRAILDLEQFYKKNSDLAQQAG